MVGHFTMGQKAHIHLILYVTLLHWNFYYKGGFFAIYPFQNCFLGYFFKIYTPPKLL